MTGRKVYMGETPLKHNEGNVQGAYVELDGERFYKISNMDRMPDFFMSIVSASDHWMFISSNGSLTAGRKNPENALFPYYSEDKIHDYRGKTGSRTLVLVKEGAGLKLWEPFQKASTGVYSTRRNIYKNKLSNRVIFEEINEDLELTFRYGWYSSDRFGFVKRSVLINQGRKLRELELLDGLLNILPSGVDSGLQLSSSNLLDAYKRQELVPGTTLGLYRLSSIPSDVAEPSEALQVNTVWSEGLPGAEILLSDHQLESFRAGFPVKQELDVKACRGAYFTHASLDLDKGNVQVWNIVAELNQDVADIAGLVTWLQSESDAGQLLWDDVETSTADLQVLLASSDALQCTEDELSCSRHLSNVLFNVMRGGVFMENYMLPANDFLDHISNANGTLLSEARKLLGALGDRIQYLDLLGRAKGCNNPNLERLSYEYLALTFSRRHGDPSRPWNRFSIDNRKEDGSQNLDYQGNWRDIFQNWEALALSFPGYAESMIGKFVNASTADGYNPYRITRSGIDWEVPDPADPWSNIGYWGDHQLIYLLKFLEISASHNPGELEQLLSREVFSYANVPYRIKSYEELLNNPHDTILFDYALEQSIRHRVDQVGSDGKLVWDEKKQLVLVNLTEKLLVTLLSKLSNFIPGAGIWMNTQRPEWNDANNALVGYGVSMVTAYYLRAFVAFCKDLFAGVRSENISLSEEVAVFYRNLSEALSGQLQEPFDMLSERGMKSGMDAFGKAGGDYRQLIYNKGFSGRKSEVKVKHLGLFFDNVLKALDRTITSSRRDDGLYHAYNLIKVDGDQIQLRRLYEMLEGQVAVLSSGVLQPGEVLDLLDALKVSKLFREDQYSYILYPDRILPFFMEKNNIPAGEVKRSQLLTTMLQQSDRSIVIKDVKGAYHFNADFRNVGLLKEALDALPEEYSDLVRRDKDLVLDIYESLFDHQSFTGRSGTFYGYEGLGSIYWHMVSKLLLAVGDSYYRAAEAGGDPHVMGRMAEHYYEIRAGIGLNKGPELYGAFPTDPYSHTPRNRGAQQPGMTGQVKEDIISRWGELGLSVKKGSLCFNPVLLRKEEFLSGAREFSYMDIKGQKQKLHLKKNSLAFTYCQVPVIYHLSGEGKILLCLSDGKEEQVKGLRLDPEQSSRIFNRKGETDRIEVWLSPSL